MRWGVWLLSSFLGCWACLCGADLPSSPAAAVTAKLQQKDYKGAISLGLKLLPKTSGQDKSALEVQLAIAYDKDQEVESAFEFFLSALKDAPKLAPPLMTAEEKRLYKEALAIYLAHQGPSAPKAAKEIRRDFGPIVEANPQYYQLGFLVAAADANLSFFDEFFPLFYACYCRYPNHYMAYKTQALLNLKLWQRGRIPSERDELQARVFANVKAAIGKDPQDASLYKMAISFSKEDEKNTVVAACLNNIVQGNIIIPREDLIFFVQAAISANHRDLAQQLVDSAREWYRHSRAVDHAQQLVDAEQ